MSNRTHTRFPYTTRFRSVLCSSWFPADRLALTRSWVFALSNLGTVLGSTPLAWASESVGWRATFAGMAGVTAAVGLLFWCVVRDDPSGRPPVREAESLRAVLHGVGEVWRAPGLGRVLAIHRSEEHTSELQSL